MTTEVITYHLEMNSISELNEKSEPNGLSVVEAEVDAFQFNRFLYQYVGAPWRWTDKLSLADEEWKAYVDDPNLKTWVAYFKGSIAGYFELQARANGTTEIMYFGLAEQFIGKGFGGYLLSQSIKKAWDIASTKRVYVHTCTLDHASALSNYKARGFKVYKTETDS
jgi:GNAT superfamily N-acetyltransferase